MRRDRWKPIRRVHFLDRVEGNMAKDNRVRIMWGSHPENRSDFIEYEFDTLAELNAFLLGVDESIGWLDYEQIDPNADGTWPDFETGNDSAGDDPRIEAAI
jgi:hypothetical protein